MSKILFIGDSHSMGYKDQNLDSNFCIWQENNYAEIYAKRNNKQVVIMAAGGLGNREYVNFLAHALNTHNDISEVFIQSTYWGRFALAINPDLNEKAIFPLDFFIDQHESSELITRYALGFVQQDRYLQAYAKPFAQDYDNSPYNKKTSHTVQPSIRHLPYLYVQMYHYLQTHLEQQDYFRDMLLCDTLCRRKNIKMHLWNINDRCFIPKETTNFYAPLENTSVTDIDALSFIKQFSKKDLETEKVDSEHYNEYVHQLIAEHYIPYLQNRI
jgi:hypothetical protein